VGTIYFAYKTNVYIYKHANVYILGKIQVMFCASYDFLPGEHRNFPTCVPLLHVLIHVCLFKACKQIRKINKKDIIYKVRIYTDEKVTFLKGAWHLKG